MSTAQCRRAPVAWESAQSYFLVGEPPINLGACGSAFGARLFADRRVLPYFFGTVFAAGSSLMGAENVTS